MEQIENPPILLAITGASGSVYSLIMARELSRLNQRFYVIFSKTGEQVTKFEIGNKGYYEILGLAKGHFDCEDFFAPPSSGSSLWSAMVILPCTMGTLGAIANGVSNNLIHRSADCFLKEKRRLILAVRETPFNKTHLLNMLKVIEAGGVIFPAMPSFYHKPESINDMALFYVQRVLQFLGFDVDGIKRWEGLNF